MSEVLMNYSTDAKHLLIPATVWALPLFITVSLMILLWRKRNIPKDLPTYDQIPSSILSRVANKKVLAELSGNVDVIVVGRCVRHAVYLSTTNFLLDPLLTHLFFNAIPC
jgi:hypothetical protein